MQAALDAGADMVGLMFFPKSPRHVSLSEACKLADMARGKADIVAVTVNMDLDGLSRINELVQPDWVPVSRAGNAGSLRGGQGHVPDKGHEGRSDFGKGRS